MVERRALLALPLLAAAARAETLAWDHSFRAIERGTLTLDAFRGQVLLVTNTASFCGYTYQYEGLQTVHDAYRARGFTVIGVPSDDFNQESDSDSAVKQFCEVTFGIDFPMAGISRVRGPQAHPFYRWVRAQGFREPGWNFHKVLVGRDGRVAAMFGPADRPDGPRVRAAIEQALAAGA